MFSFFRKKASPDEFWDWFKANRQRFIASDTPDDTAYRQLREHLKAIDKALTYELVLGDINELQISADGIPELIPLVREIVDAAPEMKSWVVVAFRRASTTDLEIDVFGHALTADTVKLSVDRSVSPVDITVYLKGLDDDNYRHLVHCAVMILESVVGEFDLMTKIGEIEYEPLTLDLPEVVPARELAHILSDGQGAEN